jgi:hypothetical protein
MRTFRIHKTRGSSKIVLVRAMSIRFETSGALTFWQGKKLVMAYAPWAWKTVSETEPA